METPLDKTTSVSTTTLNRQSTVVHEALSYLLYLGFGSAAIAIPRITGAPNGPIIGSSERYGDRRDKEGKPGIH